MPCDQIPKPLVDVAPPPIAQPGKWLRESSVSEECRGSQHPGKVGKKSVPQTTKAPHAIVGWTHSTRPWGERTSATKSEVKKKFLDSVFWRFEVPELAACPTPASHQIHGVSSISVTLSILFRAHQPWKGSILIATGSPQHHKVWKSQNYQNLSGEAKLFLVKPANALAVPSNFPASSQLHSNVPYGSPGLGVLILEESGKPHARGWYIWTWPCKSCKSAHPVSLVNPRHHSLIHQPCWSHINEVDSLIVNAFQFSL